MTDNVKPRLHEVGEEISAEQQAAWARYWDQYDYARPIAAHLSEVFGVKFGSENTGGGCICIAHDGELEGGVYLLVGSAWDGPLLTAAERADYQAREGHPDGYGVGIYDADSGHGVASAIDWQAQTPEQVGELARRALDMAAQHRGGDTYPEWVRAVDGTVSESVKPA
jgi:hypothetical protein